MLNVSVRMSRFTLLKRKRSFMWNGLVEVMLMFCLSEMIYDNHGVSDGVKAGQRGDAMVRWDGWQLATQAEERQHPDFYCGLAPADATDFNPIN